MKLLFGIVILIILLTVFYMKFNCTGLWGKVPSKIPSNLFRENKNEPLEYSKCVYKGFKNLFK
jgi:hypothetical protein